MANKTFMKLKHNEAVVKVETTGVEIVDLDLDVDLIDTNRENLVGSDQKVSIQTILWNIPNPGSQTVTISRYLSGGTPENASPYVLEGTGTLTFDTFNSVGIPEITESGRDIRLNFSAAGTVILKLLKSDGYEAKFNPAVDGYDAVEPS